MKTVKPVFSFLLCCVLLSCFLVSCTSLSRAPRRIELVVDVAADANPNVRGRPSPVVLNVLQLTGDHRLVTADYLALLHDPDAALQQTLASAQKTLPIAPGDTNFTTLVIEKNVRYIGFVVELARFDDVQNRIVIPIETAKENGRIHIAINRAGVQRVNTKTAPQQISRFNDGY